MKHCSRILICLLLPVALTLGQNAPQSKTVVEISQPRQPTEGLRTVEDVATSQEKPFREKITEQPIDHWAGLEVPPPIGEKEVPKSEDAKRLQAEAIAKAKAYTLSAQAGQYVGWFGIVRKSTWNPTAERTELLIQHCHGDGLTDAHIQVVSICGAGDFQAIVAHKASNIPLLSLVRVYGKAAAGKDGAVEVTAEYVRIWDWGLFTFMGYGVDKTNETWRALRRIEGEKIYTSRPSTHQYYESILGNRDPSEKPDAGGQ